MGLNERLLRLEARRAPPPHETPPIVTLLAKSMDAERLELEGRPPDPANDLTPEEREADLEASRSFLETGAAALRASSSANPAALENICAMEEQAKQDLREGTSE